MHGEQSPCVAFPSISKLNLETLGTLSPKPKFGAVFVSSVAGLRDLEGGNHAVCSLHLGTEFRSLEGLGLRV